MIRVEVGKSYNYNGEWKPFPQYFYPREVLLIANGMVHTDYGNYSLKNFVEMFEPVELQKFKGRTINNPHIEEDREPEPSTWSILKANLSHIKHVLIVAAQMHPRFTQTVTLIASVVGTAALVIGGLILGHMIAIN